MDKGIDYSMGSANFDQENGIHYGVISQHSVMSEAMNDFEMDYGDPTCPKCGNTVKEDLTEDIPDDLRGYDFICLDCKHGFDSDEAYSDEAIGWHYKNEEYQIINCLDTDLMILKSPYYTFAQFCSPCVPGAGNLDTYIKDGVKTYALDHDWFENGRAPYPLYDVKTEKQIVIIETEIDCPNCQGSGRDTVKRIAEIRESNIEDTRKSLIESNGYKINDDNTFECWKCQGKGRVIEKKEEEV